MGVFMLKGSCAFWHAQWHGIQWTEIMLSETFSKWFIRLILLQLPLSHLSSLFFKSIIHAHTCLLLFTHRLFLS